MSLTSRVSVSAKERVWVVPSRDNSEDTPVNKFVEEKREEWSRLEEEVAERRSAEMKINSEEVKNEQSDKMETEAVMVREDPSNNTHTAMSRTVLGSLSKRTENSILLAVRNNLDCLFYKLLYKAMETKRD